MTKLWHLVVLSTKSLILFFVFFVCKRRNSKNNLYDSFRSKHEHFDLNPFHDHFKLQKSRLNAQNHMRTKNIIIIVDSQH